MKKRFFNMVEVLLALTVSAIGITSIMGIIPLGLKANRDAMAETYTANIADSYFAELNRLAAKNDFSTFASSKVPFPEAAKTTITVDGNTVSVYQNPTTPNPNDWKDSDGKIEYEHAFTDDGIDFDDSKLDTKHYLRVFVGKKNGSSKVLPDFAADLCGWKCYPEDIAEAEGAQTDLLRVYLEVSWPINVAYAKREKRTFVREFFNSQAITKEVEEVPEP